MILFNKKIDKKTLTIIALLIIIGISLVFLFNRKANKKDLEPEKKEEISLESELGKARRVVTFGDRLIEIEDVDSSKKEELFEEYAEIENRFFRIEDKYFGEKKTKEELKEQINQISEEIKRVEKKIINLKK